MANLPSLSILMKTRRGKLQNYVGLLVVGQNLFHANPPRTLNAVNFRILALFGVPNVKKTLGLGRNIVLVQINE